MSILNKSKQILQECALSKAQMCLATKTQSIENITEANISPKIILAENRIQELEEKFSYYNSVCNPIHFIGPLQKNKVRKAVKMCDVIQTVDSLELMERIDRIAGEEEKIQKIFLNINISEDPNKSGISLQNIGQVIDEIFAKNFQHIEITGLFTILKKDLDDKQILYFYTMLKKFFTILVPHFGKNFTELSMGMTGDYKISLKAGATMVRVGSGVFS